MNLSKHIFDNVILWGKKLTDRELHSLSQYLNGGWTERPTKVQKEFTDEFFGEKEWGVFVYEHSEAGKHLLFHESRGTQDFLNQVRQCFSYVVTKRYGELLDKVAKSEPKNDWSKTKLKKDLKEAIEESYFDGIFDKCEGWCNISDVLVNHKLITIKEDENENF